ncbi:MAG: methylglyoxal synthase [Halolamina sp.]
MPPRLALIAHDEMKDDLAAFATDHAETLADYDLVATGTTGKHLNESTPLSVERKASGSLGGDAQIGGEVASDDCHGVVFLRDPLRAQPHEPDISALLRLCDVHDVPLATNLASATALVEALPGLLADSDAGVDADADSDGD